MEKITSFEDMVAAEVERRVAERLASAGPSVTPAAGDSIYTVGSKLFIRTVTHYLVGTVCFVGPDEIGLTDAAWVANTGRFSDALKTGVLDEVEPFPSRVSVGRGAIVDATLWTHALPREQK